MLRRLRLAVVPFIVVACSSDSVVESTPQVFPPQASSIVTAATPGGVDGFSFRPPLVAAKPGTEGEFDGSLLDLLAVEICEWNGSACVGSPVRRITAQDSPPRRLRVVEGAGYYEALWPTSADNLNAAKHYRIRVLASGGELGHADVDVVANAAEAPAQSDMVVVVNGSAVPIGFRIEKGVGERAGSGGGTIELAGGEVFVKLPPGALPNDVLLTVVPATNLPPGGPPVVPGTAWDFGPDGLVFGKPVTLTISYDPANLPAGTKEAELRIHKLVNGSYVQANAGVIDLVNKKVSAEVDGFSVYVVLGRLFPGSEPDLKGPVIQAIEVFDPVSATYKNALTLELSASDVVLKARVRATDDMSGVSGILITYQSPTGRQRRFVCFVFQAPATGSDTSGEWICSNTWPQYSEAGAWTPSQVSINDKAGNTAFYFMSGAGLCATGPTPQCVADPAQIAVNSNPTDIEEPTVQSFDVSELVTPRVYGPSVSVDVSNAARTVAFRIQATDNLSGVGIGPGLLQDNFAISVQRPSGLVTTFSFNCPLVQGTALNGARECVISIPRFAEVGTWQINMLTVPDRVGNGGFGFNFLRNTAGQLCNTRGQCLTPPTIQVTGADDTAPPELQSIGLSVIGATVIFTAEIKDNISGVVSPGFSVRHSTVNQTQSCNASLTSGTNTNGVWTCTITFSQFAARGEWGVSLFVGDNAGNFRSYDRRASDGFLCYTPVGGGAPVCQNYGETSIIIQ